MIFKNCVITNGAIKSVVEWMNQWWSDSVEVVWIYWVGYGVHWSDYGQQGFWPFRQFMPS